MPRRMLAAFAAVALAAPGAGGAVIPEAVPDLPVLGAQARRGGGLVTSQAPPSLGAKVVDGSIEDWTGVPSRLGGTAYYSKGEYVYQDHLMDDWGADDGQDAERLAVTDPLIGLEPRLYRIDALAQALGDEFGAPGPETIAAEAHFGDASYPSGLTDHADIEEVRIAADASKISVLVRTVAMTQTPATAVVVYLDTAPGGPYAADGVVSTSAEWAFVAAGNAVTRYHRLGVLQTCPCPDLAAATSVGTASDPYLNAIEIGIPRALLGTLPPAIGVGVGAGLIDAGGGLRAARQGDARSDLYNVAFRFDEPARIWMDHDQALALRDGNIDRYLARVEVARLQGGYNETFEIRPGYYERIYVSSSPVRRETQSNSYSQGAFQHYGLYLPSAYRPGARLPATFWLHYRGGRAHDAQAWLPGVVRQLGEARGNIMVMPGARGTSSWYVGRGHEDFLEAWDDAMASFPIDADRVYVSGYSMGGYGSWLLGLLYPDRFAGAFPTSGALTCGAWAGGDVVLGADECRTGGLQNEAENARKLLSFPLVPNARNLPYAIYHGTNDELVPPSGVTLQAAALAQLGYRYRYYQFPGYEHYTHAIVDEWTDAARYLDTLRRDPDPPRVTYRVIPALERAVERVSTPAGTTLDYDFDGAYWVDDLSVRSGDPDDPRTMGEIDAETDGRGRDDLLAIPEAGTAGQSTPYWMTGMRWHRAATVGPANRLRATMTNLAGATLDLARMGIATGATITASIDTDGPTTLRLGGSWAAPPLVNGTAGDYAGGVLTIPLGAGSHTLEIQPA